MFIRGISHGFNGTHDKLVMARKGYCVIFLDILFSRTTWWGLFVRYLHCTYMYVALTVFSNSHYGYCKSFCRLIMSYHMFDAVTRGMFAPPDKVAYTNTINDVLCISDTLL